MRGYDREEVSTFLEALSLEFAQLFEENEKLKSDIEYNKNQIEDYKKLEKTLQSTLMSAQESSSKAVESAKKQNALIIKEAEIKAAQLVDRSKEEVTRLQDAVLELSEEKKLLLAKLKAMVETQVKVLDSSSSIIKSKPAPVKQIKNKDEDIDVDDILEKLL